MGVLIPLKTKKGTPVVEIDPFATTTQLTENPGQGTTSALIQPRLVFSEDVRFGDLKVRMESWRRFAWTMRSARTFGIISNECCASSPRSRLFSAVSRVGFCIRATQVLRECSDKISRRTER
jgi:hypothetical protein